MREMRERMRGMRGDALGELPKTLNKFFKDSIKHLSNRSKNCGDY